MPLNEEVPETKEAHGGESNLTGFSEWNIFPKYLETNQQYLFFTKYLLEILGINPEQPKNKQHILFNQRFN